MINDHLVANITQLFQFPAFPNYLKGCTKFILTVCVVYNAVISDWLTLTKPFQLTQHIPGEKTSPLRLCTNMALLIFLAKAP